MRSKVIFFVVLSLLLLFLFTWVGKEVVVKQRGTKSDFFDLWYGSNLILHRTSPYSPEATLVIHENISGRPLGPGVYVHSFPYPAYLVVDLLPFAALPYSTAFIVWTGIQIPMLFIALYLLARFMEIKLNAAGWVILFVGGSIGFLYPLVSYALGQTSILFLFLLALVFFFLEGGKLIEAGILLAVTSIRPDIFAITCIASLIILWKSKQNLKQLAVTAIASIVLMNLISVFLLGFWYVDWVNILLTYSGANPKVYWPLDMLPTVEIKIAFILIFFIYLIWQTVQFLRTPTKGKQLLAISALILVYLLVNKLTGTYLMTLLLIPALVLYHSYSRLKLGWLIWIIFFMPLAYWAVPAGLHPWSDQLLIPLGLLVLQVIFVLTDMNRINMNETVIRHETIE